MKNIMEFIDWITDLIARVPKECREEQSGLFNWTAQEIREDNYNGGGRK